MRNPKSLKERHGLPEYVAYANLRQGIRPFVRATRYSIAVVRPTGTDAASYKAAARIYVGSRRFESNRVVGFSKEKPHLATGLAFEAMRHPKSILLFPDMASVPAVAGFRRPSRRTEAAHHDPDEGRLPMA